MILKTYYHLPACQAPITSPIVQPDDMVRRHGDEEHNPLERPQASEEEEKGVADGTSSTDQGGDFVSKTKAGMDHETLLVTARRLVLPIDRQQREVTTTSTEKGGDYPTQANLEGNPTAIIARVATREEAAIGRYQRGTTSTDQNQQFDHGEEG